MTLSDAPILDALRLRRWSLTLLGGTQLPSPSLSPAGWSLFLGREACAPHLLALAGPDAPAPLREAASRDAQMILLLRAELQGVLEVAAKIGVAPVILKGGAALHDGPRAVRAGDLDLLLSPPEAEALAAALDAAGWRPHGGGSPKHLAKRVRAEAPPVEIHTTDAEVGAHLAPAALTRARPHPTHGGARLLHPDDQIRHLAIHQAIEHPAFRGRLRDLLLLGDTLPSASGADPVERWGLPPLQQQAVVEVVAMAAALHARNPTSDPFESIAAARYLLEAAHEAQLTGPFRLLETLWTNAFLAGGGAIAEQWRQSWTPRLEARSNHELVTEFGTHHSRLGGALRVGARAAALPFILASAKYRAGRVRREAARLLTALDQRK